VTPLDNVRGVNLAPLAEKFRKHAGELRSGGESMFDSYFRWTDGNDNQLTAFQWLDYIHFEGSTVIRLTPPNNHGSPLVTVTSKPPFNEAAMLVGRSHYYLTFQGDTVLVTHPSIFNKNPRPSYRFEITSGVLMHAKDNILVGKVEYDDQGLPVRFVISEKAVRNKLERYMLFLTPILALQGQRMMVSQALKK